MIRVDAFEVAFKDLLPDSIYEICKDGFTLFYELDEVQYQFTVGPVQKVKRPDAVGSA